MSDTETKNVVVNRDCKIAANGCRVYDLKEGANEIPEGDAEEVRQIAEACGWTDEGTDTAVSFDEAVTVLDPEKDEDFTADGRPDVNALKALGCVMTAAERDEAWAAYQASQDNE